MVITKLGWKEQIVSHCCNSKHTLWTEPLQNLAALSPPLFLSVQHRILSCHDTDVMRHYRDILFAAAIQQTALLWNPMCLVYTLSVPLLSVIAALTLWDFKPNFQPSPELCCRLSLVTAALNRLPGNTSHYAFQDLRRHLPTKDDPIRCAIE